MGARQSSAYDASDLWLGIPRGAWRDYDFEFYGARSKPRSVWPVQPPAAIADPELLCKWMRLMHQFGVNAKCLDHALDRSRPYHGNRDVQVRSCTKDQRRQLELLRELEAEAGAAAAAASVDTAIADVTGRHAAAAPPPPPPPRYTRRLAGLCISTEVERPTRLRPDQVVRLKICHGVDWRRSAAFPECEFHSTLNWEEEGNVYYVAVRSAGSSSAHAAAKPAKRPSQATAAQSAKKPRR
jgi:hypothetical protein